MMKFKSAINQLACLLLATGTMTLGNAAAEESGAEISVKAVIVHKIAKFVSWPDARFDGKDAMLRLCVIGDRMVLDAFEALGERPIQGRTLQVLTAPEPTAAAESCEVLFLGGDNERAASEWLDAVSGHPVLTFGNAGAYGADGSIVTMTIRRNKVRFDINLDANRDTGLRISAQLLQLAAKVGKTGG